VKDKWRASLRDLRKRLGLSLESLAERTGLSYETLRGYENGRRSPTRASLALVLGQLDPSAADANEIFTGAGFSVDARLFPDGEFATYFFTVSELREAVERVPWPEFVLDDREELVAANFATRALWNMESSPDGTRPHILRVAYDYRFGDRVRNWDECARTLASVFKGHPREPRSNGSDDPSSIRDIAMMAAEDPAFFAPLLQVWVSAEPVPAKARWEYPVRWSAPGGDEIRFLSVVSVANERDGLSFHDWHPVDPDSWAALDGIKRRAHRRQNSRMAKAGRA
jgi:transcriptional regulator with XRE-family HTH domain